MTMREPYVRSTDVSNTVNALFAEAIQTRSDKVLLRTCQVSGIVAFALQSASFLLATPSKTFQAIVLTVAAVSAVTFIITMCILGVRTVGFSHGRRTFANQLIFTLSRVVLYLFLPCAIITALLVVWAILTKQPAFR